MSLEESSTGHAYNLKSEYELKNEDTLKDKDNLKKLRQPYK